MDPSETQRVFKMIFDDLFAAGDKDLEPYKSRWAKLPDELADVVRKMNANRFDADTLANNAKKQYIDPIYKEIDDLIARGQTRPKLTEIRQMVQRLEGKLAFAAGGNQVTAISPGAIAWWQKVVALYGEGHDAHEHLELGMACTYLRRYPEAIEFLQKAQATDDQTIKDRAAKFIKTSKSLQPKSSCLGVIVLAVLASVAVAILLFR